MCEPVLASSDKLQLDVAGSCSERLLHDEALLGRHTRVMISMNKKDCGADLVCRVYGRPPLPESAYLRNIVVTDPGVARRVPPPFDSPPHNCLQLRGGRQPRRKKRIGIGPHPRRARLSDFMGL